MTICSEEFIKVQMTAVINCSFSSTFISETLLYKCFLLEIRICELASARYTTEGFIHFE